MANNAAVHAARTQRKCPLINDRAHACLRFPISYIPTVNDDYEIHSIHRNVFFFSFGSIFDNFPWYILQLFIKILWIFSDLQI